MQFKQTTILGLFDNSQKQFIIPIYQRAYAWGQDQWKTFIDDLKEQINGENNYFYGNLLLETIKKDVCYEIIDGQQRLTTLTVFLRVLFDILEKRNREESEIKLDFETKERMYFKNGGNIKIRPVDYDRSFFDSLIIERKNELAPATPSQQNIKSAKMFFESELEKISTNDLIKILEKIETTEITCIELDGKKDSALMFELQNNRGKDLTNLEKLKSYFMYQMYIYSSEEETETNIESVSNIFKHIYLIINDLNLKNLNEDSILIYHCNAFIKGYAYRTLDDIKDAFKYSKNKVQWIKDFVNELHVSFSNMKKMENSQLPYLQDLRQLSIPAFAYPFIIKGYKFFGDNNTKLNELFHILEIVVFRYRLINSRADFVSRLNEILQSFVDDDLNKLKNHFKDKLNDSWYWSDERTREYLDGHMYGNKVLNYLLWKYEDSLQNKGYKTGRCEIENEQIEHISPQNPSNGDPIALGYDIDENNEYSMDFIKNELNSLGNLMLISGSHNASIGNKKFSQKILSYKSNPLLKQQAEIVEFLNENNEKWHAIEIGKRQKKIVEEFAVPKWHFDNLQIS